jgi:hypothetical protein
MLGPLSGVSDFKILNPEGHLILGYEAGASAYLTEGGSEHGSERRHPVCTWQVQGSCQWL